MVLNIEWMQFVLKNCEILHFVQGLLIKTAPHSTLSPQMCCIKKNKRLVCTRPDLLARICKLLDRKKFGLFCFPRLIYYDQEPLLLLNLTVRLFGCTYKAISTRHKICFTPKSLNFSMGASLLAVAKSIYHTYWNSHHFNGLFISNLSKMLKFAATNREILNEISKTS